MGKAITIVSVLCIALCCISCNSMLPFGNSGDNAAVALKLSTSSFVVPDKIIISVSGQNGYYLEKEAPFNSLAGLTFTDIPPGQACIDASGFLGQAKLMFGHGTVNLKSGNNSFTISLNNTLTSYFITLDEENLFDKLSTTKTPFWSAFTGRSFAQLEKNLIPVTARVQSAVGANAIYLSVQIEDECFAPGPGDSTNDEWTNDFFVVYFCPRSPLEPDFITAPIFRIQVKTGESIPNNGMMQWRSYHVTLPSIEAYPIKNSNYIQGKIVTIQTKTRCIELRIPKDKIGLANGAFPGDKIGIALRYNDSDTSATPNKAVIDWKSNVSTLKPVERPECWGILEFN